MSAELEPIKPPIHPRPGVLKALGICNIVFAALSGLCILWSGYFMLAMMANGPAAEPVRVNVQVKSGTAPASAGPMIAFNPFVGMNEPKFLLFTYVENGTSLITNALMFATGIGLVNLKRWGVRGWTYVAWVKIALHVLLWGYYIVAVAPTFSESLARNVLTMIQQQPGARRGMPTVGDLTRIYSIMNLIVAVGAMIISSLYPAISLWLLSRPGVKAAIVDKPATEPELT